MGLQNRDENCLNLLDPKTVNRISNRSYKIPVKSNAWLKYLFFPLIALTPFCFAANQVPDLKDVGNAFTPVPASNSADTQKPQQVLSPGVILKADRQGHFRGMVLINNVSMPFLIDTGATTTSIPYQMALAAHLTFGQSIQTYTAGGQVLDSQTRIKTLKIGNIELKDLDAHINEYLEEVLIGMNTLKYFHMLQTGNTLTLVANNTVLPGQGAQLPKKTEDKPNKKPFNMKKSVTCDEQKVCKTAYSDH